MEGKNGIADLSWWRNGEGLVILSKSGEAIEYSVSQKQAIARWHDQDLVSPTVVCLGGSIRRENGLGSDKWLAIGSQSGIVSIYDRSEWLVATSSSSSSAHSIPANPTACKTLQQLTTPISHMTFSSDAQLFLMSSRWKKDALRLVHVGSWTVYPRWPTNGTPLGRITAVALSPDHGSAGGGKRGRMMLVVGNEAGKIRSWEIK